MVGKSVEIGYEQWVGENFGEEADQRFALDEVIDRLLEEGWAAQALASQFADLPPSEALSVATKLIGQSPSDPGCFGR